MARAKDNRLFIRLDLDYADHPKIAVLSDAAFRAHVTMMLYARKYETDGVIKNQIANRLGYGSDTEVLAELQNNDDEAPSLILRDDGDFELHGFTDMQETRAEIRARTERNRENGAKGGRPRKRKETQSVTDSGSDSGTQTKAETETETETDKEIAKAISTRGARLAKTWKPTTADVEAIAQQCPGLDTQAEHPTFVDYWIAQPGQKGVKTDWSATWRNWMRRKYGDQGGHRPVQRPMNAVEKARAIAADMQFGGKEIEQ